MDGWNFAFSETDLAFREFYFCVVAGRREKNLMMKEARKEERPTKKATRDDWRLRLVGVVRSISIKHSLPHRKTVLRH